MKSLKWLTSVTLVCLIGVSILGSATSEAAPVTTQSGRVLDINAEQAERLKHQTGIHYFEYNPERIMKNQIDQWEVIALPQELGGGFLMATSANMNTALEVVGVTDLSDQPAGRTETRPAVQNTPPGRRMVQMRFDTGYRRDELNWSIADPSGSPNILSELKWEDIQILQLKTGIDVTPVSGLLIKGMFAYGFIFEGTVQDSDYAGDNRTLEFSRSNNSADDGNTLDASIALGWVFPLFSDHFHITPLLGYSIHVQNLTATDGYQTIPPLGSFSGLDSTYDTQWHGVWFGGDIAIRFFRNNRSLLAHEILLGGEYHYEADYYAQANWNLRPDFAHPKSFEHEADGQGVILTGEYRYYFNRHWSLNLNGNYQKWDTDPGIDRVFFSDGTIAETRLNEVNWESYAVMIGVNLQF